jgi:hypothetical protein
LLFSDVFIVLPFVFRRLAPGFCFGFDVRASSEAHIYQCDVAGAFWAKNPEVSFWGGMPGGGRGSFESIQSAGSPRAIAYPSPDV